MVKKTGLAVLPTWLVLRDHQPIEHDKIDDTLTHINDEEQHLEQPNGNTGKGGLIVDETRVTE